MDVQEKLADVLMPYFEHKKYVWHSDINQFIRPTRFGHAGVVANVIPSAGSYYIEFFIGIRHDLVENSLRTLWSIAPYYQKQSYTLLPSYGVLNALQNGGRFFCDKLEDIYRSADAFTHFMDMKGFDFLDHYRKLANLDYLFNEHAGIGRRWSNYSYQYSFRAMMLAKLRNRHDIDILYGIHRSFLIERGYTGSLIEKFDANFAQLKILSLN
jgi:hypothetical protein